MARSVTLRYPHLPTHRQRSWQALTGVVLGMGALGLAAFLMWPAEPIRAASHEPPVGAPAPKPTELRVSVTVADVGLPQTGPTARFAGVLQAGRRATLSFAVPGRVASRPVELGDRVEAGRRLATLDRRDLQRARDMARATVQRAEAQLDFGQKMHARVRELNQANAASVAALDDAEHTTRVAAASRDEAASLLARTERALAEGVLLAPFGGVLSRVAVEAGEHVGPGQPVLELVDDGELELEVEVPESWLPRVELGAEVEVALPMVERRLVGRVRTIGDAARGGGLFPVVIALALPEASRPGTETFRPRAGMTAELVLHTPPPSGLAVPVEAVVDRSGSAPQVYVVEGDIVKAVPVRVLGLAGSQAVIEAPLERGDVVVTRGHVGFIEGARVHVAK